MNLRHVPILSKAGPVLDVPCAPPRLAPRPEYPIRVIRSEPSGRERVERSPALNPPRGSDHDAPSFTGPRGARLIWGPPYFLSRREKPIVQFARKRRLATGPHPRFFDRRSRGDAGESLMRYIDAGRRAGDGPGAKIKSIADEDGPATRVDSRRNAPPGLNARASRHLRFLPGPLRLETRQGKTREALFVVVPSPSRCSCTPPP